MSSVSDPTEYEHLLHELRAARQRSGVTQVELATALGQRQTYVSKCELGQRRLDVMELRAWVQGLGLDFVAFIEVLEDRLARHAKPRLRR